MSIEMLVDKTDASVMVDIDAVFRVGKMENDKPIVHIQLHYTRTRSHSKNITHAQTSSQTSTHINNNNIPEYPTSM